jgi:predicted aminopeptidase
VPRALAVLLALALSGCGSVGYYAQSVQGQLGVMAASRPVEDVIDDPKTPESVRRQLQALPLLRQFAVDQLALPESGSYRLYADLKREALVWNVVAAPVDSLKPREWCYPVIGCAAYRGYFNQQAANDFAAGLAAEGWDTAVEPVPAYSTLGWFSDPLPSTVIDWSLPEIAGLLFHELAHEALYVRGDSAFNEAYATVVEKEGVRRWLQQAGSAEQRSDYQRRENRRLDFLRLLLRTRQRLSALYAEGAGADELVLRKRQILQLLRVEYADLKQAWGGYAGYDRWMGQSLNNAHLASINTYHALEPAFRFILRLVDGDMAAFHAACAEIAAALPAERKASMDSLTAAAKGD